ncbi:MAG: hypothetical protein R3190_04135 [Thermoanaerobaculia bacterium]|nr:hypothetical protein [Thermoanaerobaculia bacterium]
MNRARNVDELLAAASTWPQRPRVSPSFHDRLGARLTAEAGLRRRRRLIRWMRVYWLATSVMSFLILYDLPSRAAGLQALTALGVAIGGAALLVGSSAARPAGLGDLFVGTVED